MVACASKTLSDAECSYCTTHKELLAVVVFVEKFKCYLQGNTFLIRTDHQALKYLTTFKEPTGQLARWLEKLQDFNFEIEHRPGQKHANADTLSRLCPKLNECPTCIASTTSLVAPVRKQQLTVCPADPSIVPIEPPVLKPRTSLTPAVAPVPTRPPVVTPPPCGDPPKPVTSGMPIPAIDKWPALQQADNALGAIFKLINGDRRTFMQQELDRLPAEAQHWYSKMQSLELRDGVLMRIRSGTSQLCAPMPLHASLISMCHDSVEGGHYGVQKTLDKIKLRFYWPNMRHDVEEHCRVCLPCQLTKSTRQSRADIISVGTGFPGQWLGIDVVDFTTSKAGFKHCLTMIDYFTRYAEVVPIHNTKAETIAKTIFKEWICHYGAPHVIHSDQGRNVDNNAIMNSLCQLFDVDKTRTTPYRPQCNGATERIHRTLSIMLKCFLSNHQDWDELLPGCLMAYRCSLNARTKYSPFELLFGQAMTLPLDIILHTPDECLTQSDFVSKLRVQLNDIGQSTCDRVVLAQQASKCAYASSHKTRKVNYHVGQHVWLYAPHKNLTPGGKLKLTQPWTGPYRILRQLSPVNYEVQLMKCQRGGELVVHVEKLKLVQSLNPEVDGDANVLD